MAENLNKKPSKSILKNSSSFDTPDAKMPSTNRSKTNKGGAKWDEMNIMATLHPPDKDYGHMKIDEPKTPYNYEGLDLDVDSLDADALAAKIRETGHDAPKALRPKESDSDEEDDPEELAAKRDFEARRKKHYNEFYAVKLARKLLEKDEDEDEDDDDKDQPQKS